MSNKPEEKLASALIRVYERIKEYTDRYEQKHGVTDENFIEDDVEYQAYCNVLEWISWDVEFGVKTTLKIKEKETK